MAASLKIQGLAKRGPFIKVFRWQVFCTWRFGTCYPANGQRNTMGFQMDSHVVLIYRAVAGWWAVSEQETPETTLASVNLNHISVLRSQFSQKLNWKEGEKKKCTFLPRMLSFRCCKDTKLVLHKADHVSCLFPLKREQGKMENGFFSNIQAVICVRPAKLLFYWSPWQVLSRWSLVQPV